MLIGRSRHCGSDNLFLVNFVVQFRFSSAVGRFYKKALIVIRLIVRGGAGNRNGQLCARLKSATSNVNVARRAVSSIISSTLTAVFALVGNNCTLFTQARIFTKVDCCRNRPSIPFCNFVLHLCLTTTTGGILFLNLSAVRSISRKHRGRADGNRQRGCEEQGGRFLRQFHNPYSAMGPAADGQPWICLLLSHHMVC